MPFALFYSHYLCCVYEQKQEVNNFKWGAAFIVWNLSNMFSGGKSELSFENLCEDIGMFSIKKNNKERKRLDSKTVESDKSKAYDSLKNVFGIPLE